MTLNYLLEKHSKKDAPLMVMVNGLLADYQSFDGASFYGREFFHVLRYNCRGQEQLPQKLFQSAENRPITLTDHVDDLKELVKRILNQLPDVGAVFFVGLSNGGRIVLKASEDHHFVESVKLKSVVAMDTYDELTPLLHLKLKSWLQASLVGGALHRFDVASPWIWGETFFKEKEEVILSYRQKIVESGKSETSMDVVGLLSGALKNESPEDRVDLSKVLLPVLLIVGDEDLLTTPNKHQEMMGIIKNGTLKIIQKMGHAGLIENPMLMKNEIVPYIKAILDSH